MDFFLISVVASTGAAIAASLGTTFPVKERLQQREQTKVERILEQKELSYWLVKEVTELTIASNVPKERVAEVLNQVIVLKESANLFPFSTRKINDCINAASTALQIVEKIDRRYMLLLSKLVEGTAQAVVKTSGEKETVTQSLKISDTLAGVLPGFRKYTGNPDQINEWKNEVLSKKRKT